MPLVRFEVKNEYGLGQSELYREVDRENPKDVLNGVAVAGLVGILRQLGDLAEFAAEVFHGLQEQVMTTASRSHKLTVRIQNIEAAIPPLEKAVLAQTSHIHFAYTAGREWHPRIQNERNHFIYTDLPRFIMDSYEECHDPPRFHLLDKFDMGGPGSCLKRYSDPTFFKRAPGNPNEADNEKILREKKYRKSKKKRSRRNGDISRAFVSNQSGSMQFASVSASGKSCSPQTASHVDTADKSDHSNSFDTVSGSAHTESVCNLGHSVQPGKTVSKESSSSFTEYSGVKSSVLSDEGTEIIHENFMRCPSQEQVVSASSCSTVDEKAEILKLKGQRCYDEAPEMLETNFGPDTPDRIAADLRNDDKVDTPDSIVVDLRCANRVDTCDWIAANITSADRVNIPFDDIDTQNLPSSRNQLNEINSGSETKSEPEIESETENYMDALNTIDSESENDLGQQTVQERGQYPCNLNNEELKDTISDHVVHIPEHNLSIVEEEMKDGVVEHVVHSPDHDDSFAEEDINDTVLESEAQHTVEPDHSFGENHTASNIAAHDGISTALPEPALSENVSDNQMLQVPGRSIDSSCSPSNGSPANCDVLNYSKGKYVVPEPSLSTPNANTSELPNPLGNRIINTLCKTQESEAEVSGVETVSIWTNGGLLGLEPSKPPDFAASSSANQNGFTKSENEVAVHPGGQKERPSRLTESVQSFQKIVRSSNEKAPLSFADLDAKPTSFCNSQPSNRFGDADGVGLAMPGPTLRVSSNENDTPSGSNRMTDELSSGVFGLSQRLLMNDFRRRGSFVCEAKSTSATTSKTDLLANDLRSQPINQETLRELYSSFDMLTSSPPLEHMKISFKPIDGYESSNLKLRFPDGNRCHEGNKDTFPSFQLVPELASTLRDNDFDSDDDTFCRSSPYMSDDYLSDASESNSEQWESDASPDKDSHKLYDALRRMSTLESSASSMQVGTTAISENHDEPSFSSPSFDLPSFDAVNAAVLIGARDSDSQHMEPTSSQPPLPPVQWLPKSHSDVGDNKQCTLLDVLKQKVHESADSQKLQAAPVIEKQSNEEAAASKPERKSHEQQRSNGQKEVNQSVNSKNMGESEDFLHQIRTKSFNLRRTGPVRPTMISGPTPNMKVSAILEKANAIRQAVGSDDDNWSDT